MARYCVGRWLLAPAALLLATALLAGCNMGFVVGSGNIVSEERTISGVEGVSLSFVGDLQVTQGDEEKLVITGDDNVLPLITSDVRDGVLHIGGKTNLGIPTTVEVRYDLTVRDLNSLGMSGAGNAEMDGLETGDLSVDISGAGNLSIRNLQAGRVSAEMSGLGNLELSGKADRVTVDLSGAGNYDGGDLQTGAADVSLSGLGNATVWATESLNASISGAGSIEYYDDPDVEEDVSGLGGVNSLGDK